MKWTHLIIATVLPALVLCYGCASLLPTAKDTTKFPWNSFEEARTAYNKVVPNTTTVKQLRDLGFNIYSSPNLKVLNYVDIAVATQSIKSQDFDGGIERCLRARNNCRGYQFEPSFLKDERYGNFWLDLFNFKRKNRQTGWRFIAVFFVIDDLVIEKVWSGSPSILIEKEGKNPLGPFQEGAGFMLRAF